MGLLFSFAWSRVVTAVTATVVSCVAALALAPPASAEMDPTPVGPQGWVPDAPVRAVVPGGDRVYVGGSFTGGVAALDATTGALVWTADVGGDVRALALSADGSHLLVGGAFTTVDGQTHRKLASLRVEDGVAEPKWKGSAGGTVRDLVVVGDTAYFGGGFSKHSGLAQANLGAVSVTTGKAVPEFTTGTNGVVYSLATDGSRLFVGGKFTAADGLVRETLASVTLATHTLDAWAPLRACTRCNIQWDLLVHGDTVFSAGRNAGAVYAVDKTTAAVRWKANRVNGDAQALTIADGKLFVGGHFVQVYGQERIILAAFDPATGALDPFSTRFVTTWPGIWALASQGSRLYVAGDFTAAGPKPNRYPYFAMFGTVEPPV